MNKKIEKICIIAEGYPTAENPIYSFVDQLACSLSELGIQVTVIAPQSLSKSLVRKIALNPIFWSKKNSNGNDINIYQPYYFTFSNIKFAEKFHHFLFEKIVLHTFKKYKIETDVFYGHFWNCGLIAAELGRKYNKNSFIASGESIITVFSSFNVRTVFKRLPYVKGVICVSSANQDQNIKMGLATIDNSKVIVNAVNLESFYKYDKYEAREKLGFPKDPFIVCFVGSFTKRKGVRSLSSALKELNNNSIKSIFIGEGSEKPENQGLLFCGRVPHDQIVHYLNASDVFVLPTLAEGCSNAIIEAMACGLPIISSNMDFNWDILDSNNSVLIDPEDISSIRDAINFLQKHPIECNNMANASYDKSKNFLINQRAIEIINFISSR